MKRQRHLPIMVVLAMAGCAAPRPQTPVASAPSPSQRPAPERPRVPAHIDIALKLPEKGADGRYVTANSNLGPLETMFHFRSALNVAALGCASAGNTAPRDGYNAFLKRHRSVLANANRAIDAKYRRDFGAEGLRVRDAKLTSLYNQFSYPPVKRDFCRVTAHHLGAANALAPRDLEAYSQGALAEIEQLFQDYYAEVATYQARYGRELTTSR